MTPPNMVSIDIAKVIEQLGLSMDAKQNEQGRRPQDGSICGDGKSKEIAEGIEDRMENV